MFSGKLHIYYSLRITIQAPEK